MAPSESRGPASPMSWGWWLPSAPCSLPMGVKAGCVSSEGGGDVFLVPAPVAGAPCCWSRSCSVEWCELALLSRPAFLWWCWCWCWCWWFFFFFFFFFCWSCCCFLLLFSSSSSSCFRFPFLSSAASRAVLCLGRCFLSRCSPFLRLPPPSAPSSSTSPTDLFLRWRLGLESSALPRLWLRLWLWLAVLEALDSGVSADLVVFLWRAACFLLRL